MREDGARIGVVVLKSFRPFPFRALREALMSVQSVLVMERMVSAGGAGAVSLEVMKALKGLPVRQSTLIAGLGGHARSLEALFCPGARRDAGGRGNLS